MNLDKVTVGKNPPEEVNAIIEIPMESGPIKYEFDKDSGMLKVDRVMITSMSYPCNYGFVPHTLSGDGDPVDILVYTNYPLQPGCVISVRPVGVLVTQDEKGQDEKVLSVPTAKVDPHSQHINSYKDLPAVIIDKIEHFFENYKKLEKGKWVKVEGWKDAKEAKAIINEAIKRHG